jgi:hypothetical protein
MPISFRSHLNRSVGREFEYEVSAKSISPSTPEIKRGHKKYPFAF